MIHQLVGLEPDQEFGGDVLGLEQVFASVGLSVDPSPNESLEDQALHSWHLELLPENRVMTTICFSPEATGKTLWVSVGPVSASGKDMPAI